MIAEKIDIGNSMKEILDYQTKFLLSKSDSEKKKLGQFFTGEIISNYMASLISLPTQRSLKVLDAGAGTGILTASVAFHCLELGITNLNADLYEIDEKAIPYLRKSLEIVKNIFIENGAQFTYKIICDDYILNKPENQVYDISVINPPYFKYSARESKYSKATSDLFKGDPNIYASFMAVTLNSIKPGGQMISISPRSFTNGLYFKGFRTYILNNASLDLIHIFKSRNKLFNDGNSKVLQENIICRFTKDIGIKEISIVSSESQLNIPMSNRQVYPKEFIISKTDELKLIRIPETQREADILIKADNLANTFESTGYFISTGRVVEHRTREYINCNTESPNSIPLYRPHNITPPLVTWHGTHKKDVVFELSSDHHKHTVSNDNYVLLKRFTSKDESKRLVSSLHMRKNCNSNYIGIGNKLNYVGLMNGSLDETEAFGLMAVFNSSFMDKYFRCISGNTQVNSTEVRVMMFPSRIQVKKIGEELIKLTGFDQTKIDNIVNLVAGLSNSKPLPNNIE